MAYLPDANTVALWEGDDAKAPARITSTDLTTNYTATSASDSLSPIVGGDPSRTAGAYSIGGRYNHDRQMRIPKDAAMVTLLQGEFTVEFWMWNRLTIHGGGVDRYVVADWVNGTGTTAALFGLGMDLDDWIILYRSSAPATVLARFGAGPTLADGWHHYACTVEVSGANRTCTMYIDGVLDAATTNLNVTVSATEGDTNDLALMTPQAGTAAGLAGLLSAIRFSDVVKTPAELVTSAARPGFDFPTDGDTVINFDFSDVVPELDCAVGGHPLVPDQLDLTSHRNAVRAAPLIGCINTDFSRLFHTAVNGIYYEGFPTPEFIAMVYAGNWTFETWIEVAREPGALARGIFQLSGWPAAGTGGADANWLLAIKLASIAADQLALRVDWETGGGTSHQHEGTIPLFDMGLPPVAGKEFDVRHHIGVASENIAGFISLHFYLDGVFIETVATGAGPAEGGLHQQNFNLGNADNGVETRCKLQHTMFSDVTRDATWFTSSYEEGIALTCGAGGATGVRDHPALPRITPGS